MAYKDTLPLTFGFDPEVMLKDRQQDGKIVSALKVLRQDKHDPIDLKDGIKCYADNVLLELAAPPTRSPEQAVNLMRTCFIRAQEHLGDRYELLPQAAYIYDQDELCQVQAKNRLDADGIPVIMDPWESGCNPNYDAYRVEQNEPANFTNGERTGSFHIHIGNADCDTEDEAEKLLTRDSVIEAVRVMDMFVGCGVTMFERDPTSNARRRLYGKAGEFRRTPYGFEYRVLGNWVLSSPETMQLAMDLSDYAMTHIRNDTARDLMCSIDQELVKRAINDNEPRLAEMVLEFARLPKNLYERVHRKYQPDFNSAWAI